jgi:hypothetical protein
MLSYHSLFLLKKLFSQPQFNNLIGLPRGICISATLSEIYMREIDNWLNREPGIYYYARFVDDIIIFAINKDIIDSVKVKLKNKLNDKKLTINLQKTSILNGNDIKKEKPLEYLGYKFCVSKNKKSKRVVISIADKKIAKFKTRIILSFLDYFKNNDFDLLKNRLVLLSGNFHLRENDDGVFLNAGIYYSYSQINDYTALSELNMFYRKIIYSKKGRFGNNIVNSISEDQKRILLKYSFKFGFINKVCHL